METDPAYQTRGLPPPTGGFPSGSGKTPASKIGRVVGNVKMVNIISIVRIYMSPRYLIFS